MEKITRFILVPILLIVVGTLLALYLYQEVYPTAIQTYHDSRPYVQFVSGPVIKGNVIRGELISPYDNLGAVKLRVHTYNRINHDSIRFRIREKGNTAWYAINTYAVDRFADGLLYPFGFPVISDSQGKMYEFEVYSDTGTLGDSIGLDNRYHAVASQYIYSKNAIMHDKVFLKKFILQKFSSFVTDPYFILYYCMFLVPAIFYFIMQLFRESRILAISGLLSLLYILAVYIYVPIAMNSNALLYILLVSAIELFLFFHILVSSVHVYYLTIIFVVQMLFNIALKHDLEARRVAVSTFYLMVFAVGMSVVELYRDFKKRE